MSILKAGDMAIVVKTFVDHSSLGKVVTLVELAPSLGVFSSPVSGDTRCSTEKSPSWVCLGDMYPDAYKKEHGWGLFLPEQLLKITPDEDNESLKEKEEEKYGINFQEDSKVGAI